MEKVKGSLYAILPIIFLTVLAAMFLVHPKPLHEFVDSYKVPMYMMFDTGEIPPPCINIVVYNISTNLDDSTVAVAVHAIQRQVTEDFAPVWNINANVVMGNRHLPMSRDTWKYFITDTIFTSRMVGYHMD